MAFRRRRRRPVSWLPIFNEQGRSYFKFAHDGVGPAGGQVTNFFPLTFDIPTEAIAGGGAIQTLADYEQSGYLLQRVVGKFFASIGEYQDAQTPQAAAVIVGFGLMVLRVDANTGQPLAASTPINYSVLDNDNVRDPWIWRRTWMLSNGLGEDFADPGDSGWSRFPSSNAEYGSAVDGPNVDTKGIKRRIGPEERLFAICSSESVFGDGSWHTRYVFDWRTLATPIKMTNRRNASR